ncbi:MAG: hypothetical protein GXY18_00240, partial [Methanomicrobiales archaeon]|nr:hypothetical protein [Methanomicrobiales archaeon]
MNIHTVNDLCDFIDKDLAWRKKELSILKGCVESQVPNNLDQIVLIRCGIALLYAHWEGFIKKASSSYLEFIKMQRLRNDQLKPNFLTLSMRHTVNFCSNSNLNSEFGKVTDFYINSMSN